MGYRHIDNLGKNGAILAFRECYALEKVHGTSAHLKFKFEKEPDSINVTYYSGGEKHEAFKALFNEADLLARYRQLMCFGAEVTVYGEAYGGKCQGMSDTYGKALQFIAFEVQVGETWLAVPDAEDVAMKLGLEFVPYNRVSTDPAVLEAQRDLPSRVAVRRGITEPRISEGVVLRPLLEFLDNRGNRIIVKFKRPEFSERASKKDTVIDPGRMEAVAAADAVAAEWVTEHRLEHVLGALTAKLGQEPTMSNTGDVIVAMVEDVLREGAGEIVDSKDVRRAIGNAAVKLFKKKLLP